MAKCEETLTEWQGVAVCEACDWNENGSDGSHGTDYGDVAGEYEMHGCPDCGEYCGEWGCGKPAPRKGWEAIRNTCGPCLGDGPAPLPCDDPATCGEWVEVPVEVEYTLAEAIEALTDRCRHGIDYIMGDNVHPCVSCSGKRDPLASYRKADGDGRFVKPYAQLPTTVRGSFGISQVRDPEVKDEPKQWVTAESAPDWCAETPTRVLPPATTHERPTGIPQWYSVNVRGATPTWADPDRFGSKVWLAQEIALRTAGKVTREPNRYITGLDMTGKGRGDVTTEGVRAWRDSADYRAEDWKSPVEDGTVGGQAALVEALSRII